MYFHYFSIYLSCMLWALNLIMVLGDTIISISFCGHCSEYQRLSKISVHCTLCNSSSTHIEYLRYLLPTVNDILVFSSWEEVERCTTWRSESFWWKKVTVSFIFTRINKEIQISVREIIELGN